MTKAVIVKTARMLGDNLFGCMASSAQNIPWVSPLPFAVAPNLDIIFLSGKDTLHSRQIRENRNCAFTVYDSNGDADHPDWVKISGECFEVPTNLLDAALNVYYPRRYPDAHQRAEAAQPAEFFTGENRHMRVYRLRPEQIYTMDMIAGELDDNRRVRVDRFELREHMFPAHYEEQSMWDAFVKR